MGASLRRVTAAAAVVASTWGGLAACTSRAAAPAAMSHGFRATPAAARATDAARLHAALLPSSTPAVYGIVTLLPAPRGGMRARVEVRNAIVGSNLAWRIRRGVCGDRADDVTPAAAYRRIQVFGDGVGRVTSRLPEALSLDRAYHVVLLVSEADQRVLACGTFTATGAEQGPGA